MVTVEEVAKLKVAELKDELKGLGLAVSGNKTELQARLTEALSKATPAGSAAVAPNANLEAKGASVASTAGTTQAVNGKASEDAADAGDPAANPISTTSTIPPVSAAPQAAAALSEAERRKQRAERFGLPATETEKLAARAARFGAVNGTASTNKDSITPMSETEKAAEADKRQARAKRFDLPVTLTPAEMEAKKKARLERFATGAADTSSVQDKLAARAQRFALAEKPVPEPKAVPATAAVTEQKAVPQPQPYADPALEAKRKAREIKFQVN